MSYSSFTEWFEARENIEFQNNFELLCESIAYSGLPFEQYWLECAMPVLLEGQYDNERMLLEGLGSKIGGWFDRRAVDVGRTAKRSAELINKDVRSGIGMAGRGLRGGSRLAGKGLIGLGRKMGGDPGPTTPPVATARPPVVRSPRNPGYDAIVVKIIDELKQEFKNHMSQFIQAVERKAHEPPQTKAKWQVIKSFERKIEDIVKNFSINNFRTSKYNNEEDDVSKQMAVSKKYYNDSDDQSPGINSWNKHLRSKGQRGGEVDDKNSWKKHLKSKRQRGGNIDDGESFDI